MAQGRTCAGKIPAAGVAPASSADYALGFVFCPYSKIGLETTLLHQVSTVYTWILFRCHSHFYTTPEKAQDGIEPSVLFFLYGNT